MSVEAINNESCQDCFIQAPTNVIEHNDAKKYIACAWNQSLQWLNYINGSRNGIITKKTRDQVETSIGTNVNANKRNLKLLKFLLKP